MLEITSAYRARIARLHEELGVPGDYASARGVELVAEAEELVDAGTDVFGRQPRLTSPALLWWRRMQEAAAADGIRLDLVSAFRSVDYQVDLLRNKLARGQSMEQILRVNAAPGFSEHHTGCAVDLTTDGCPPLEEVFEETPAYAWLCANAARFHFHLSYPRDNPSGMAYEPWHWICRAP